jgi:hypothetical protein
LVPAIAARAQGRARRAFQNGSAPTSSRKPGRKIAGVGPAGDAVGLGAEDGAEIGGEGEERAGHSLGGAISGEEPISIDPAACDGFGFEQGQDDVAAAEDQRAGPIEGVEDGEGLAGARQQRQARQKGEKRAEGDDPDGPADREGHRARLGEREVAADRVAGDSTEDDGGDLAERAAEGNDDQDRENRDGGALAVGGKRFRHAPDGLRDDGYGDDLKAGEDARPDRAFDHGGAEREGDHEDGRREGEREEGSERPERAGAHQP